VKDNDPSQNFSKWTSISAGGQQGKGSHVESGSKQKDTHGPREQAGSFLLGIRRTERGVQLMRNRKES